MCSNHDLAFLQILQEEKNIINFLDAIFGFLYRCTDFYVETGSDKKLGFPPGMIEKLVIHSFQKWKNISKFPCGTDLPNNQDIVIENSDKDPDESMTIEEESLIPQVDCEVEVETCKESDIVNHPSQLIQREQSSDCYNGAVRENYTWSQTISDIDVSVVLPAYIKTSKDLRIHLDCKEIKIEARTMRVEQDPEIEECRYFLWTTIFKGELCFKILKDKSTWSIVPEQLISIHLEKASEGWWEALIIGEPKIDLNKLDCVRNLDNMGSEEQMKVQEMFTISPGLDQKLDCPSGMIEKLSIDSFQQWQNNSKFPSGTDPPNSQDIVIQNSGKDQDETITMEEESLIPQVDHEVEIETYKGRQVMHHPSQLIQRDWSSDSYNGAVRENYTWSQTISDIDVLVELPACVKTSKDLRIRLDCKEIKIEARTMMVEQDPELEECRYFLWTTIFKGELCFKIRKDESMWSIVPGQHISIHLEKASERWWEALITGEPKIDLTKIDCSRNLDDMGSEEQMKVQELMWNHQQKLLGKPTSEQIKMEKVLRKAWDAKGSPFEGTPYDPSIINFN